MTLKHLFFLICTILSFTALSARTEKMGVTIPLSSAKGQQLLIESKYQKPYWLLSQYYETQMTSTFCGIASAVMVLNALDIQKPADPRFPPYGIFMQDSFFSPDVLKIVSKETVLQIGITLAELTAALQTYGVKAEALYATEMDVDQFRDLVKRACKEGNTYVIANYYRPIIGQIGGGHSSPIAAYNADADSVLVLDVSRYKYTATWIQLPALFKSAQTIDSDSQKSRGFIRVSSS